MSITGYLNKFEAWSPRERLLIVLTAAAVLGFCLQMLLIEPMLAASTVVERQLRNAEQLNATLLTALTASTSTEQIDALKQHIAAEQSAMQAANERIAKLSTGLISAPQMTQMLRSLLESSDLDLVSMQNLAVEPVMLEGGLESSSNVGAGLYRHRVVIELRGSYFDVVAYLQGLEQQSRRFFWHSLQYDAGEYPRGVMRLEIYTLSLEPQWLGY